MTRIPFKHIPELVISRMTQVEQDMKAYDFIPLKTLELLRYYVSSLNQCAYCLDMHFKEAIAAGETAQRLYSVAVWHDTTYYSDAERALLAWTEISTLCRQSDASIQSCYETLNIHFSPAEIAQITFALCQINSWNRLAKSFGFQAGDYQVDTQE